MTKILEKIKKSKAEGRYDSCVFELPKGFAAAKGLPENAFAVLSLQNGKLDPQNWILSDKTKTN